MEEERRRQQQQQHGPAVGARLYFNYTAGCARASSNLVGPLCSFLCPSFVLYLCASVGLLWFRRPAVVHHRNANKQKQKNRGRPTGFSPFNHARLACSLWWSLLVFPSFSFWIRNKIPFYAERTTRKADEYQNGEGRVDDGSEKRRGR